MQPVELVRPGSTVYLDFDSYDSDGASATISGLATTDIEIYKNGSITQRASDNGYALLDSDGTDFDGITGINGASVDLADNSDAGFYANGAHYRVVIATITADGQTVSFTAKEFRIGYPASTLDTTIATLSSQTSFTLTSGPAEDDALNDHWAIIHDVASGVQTARVQISDYTGSTKTVTLAAAGTFTVAATDNISIMGPMPLQPTLTARKLDVSSGGEAGIDWANVGSPTTTVGLSGTTVGTTNNLTTLPAITTGWLTNDGIAADAIRASNLHANVTTELQSGLATASALATVAGYLDTEIADIQSRLPAALTGDGNIKADSLRFSGSATAADNAELCFTGTITTLDALDTAQDTQHSTTQGRLPAALVSGRMDASVGAMAADVITADAHDESTAFPLKSADTGATQIARVGADGDTLETLSDQLDVLKTSTDYLDAQVWLDETNGSAGTTVGVNGIRATPTNTWANAVTIATAAGIKRIYLAGSAAIGSSSSTGRFVVEANGYNCNLTSSTTGSLVINSGVVFGTKTGSGVLTLRNCDVGTLVHTFAGGGGNSRTEYYDCYIDGGQNLAGSRTVMLNCVGEEHFDEPVICEDLVMGGCSGKWLLNPNGGTILANFSSASDVKITGSSGSVRLSGIVNFTDLSGGAVTIDDSGVVYQAELAATTIATLASQTSFTLATGSADNDAYNGALIIVQDATTENQRCFGTVSDYVGSTKTITLSADPGVFTMAAGDKVRIVPATSGSGASAGAIADAVLDEALSGHTTAGTAGKALSDAAAGGGGGGGEEGGVACTINVKDQAANPIPDARVWITADEDGDTLVDGAYRTDSAGDVTFTLIDGSVYYLWAQKAGQQAISGQVFTAEAD